VVRIRLDSRESERPFKGIFCPDISEIAVGTHAIKGRSAMLDMKRRDFITLLDGAAAACTFARA
jgi:hypothetical protein